MWSLLVYILLLAFINIFMYKVLKMVGNFVNANKDWEEDVIPYVHIFVSLLCVLITPLIYEFPTFNRPVFTVEGGELVEHPNGVWEAPFGPDRAFTQSLEHSDNHWGYDSFNGEVFVFYIRCEFVIADPEIHHKFFPIDGDSGWKHLLSPSKKLIIIAYHKAHEEIARKIDSQESGLKELAGDLVQMYLTESFAPYGVKTTCEMYELEKF